MAGAGSKGLMIFAAVLLIYIHMGYMHDIYSASDLIAEHSYADEHLNQLRQKREVNTNSVEYIATAELTTASWITVDYVNAYLSKLSVEIPIDNSTVIISLNITTVCQTAGTGTQCRCENSYVWPYDDCLTYQACDSISIGTCGCINGIPSSGQMCIPKSELPVIDFTVQIETNASTVLVNYIQSISSVQYAGPIIEIIMMNVTTECSSVNTGYQCKCEGQYFWPCSKCQSYGYCDAITNNTCGCISAFPASGPYCQPATEIDFTGCAVTTIPTTTATTITTQKTTATTITTQKTTVTTTKPPTTSADTTRTISMTINAEFDSTLTQINSPKYQTYSSDIISSVDKAYRSALPSYKPGSVKIIQFRAGSVISDFSIVTTSNTLDFSAANQVLASILSEKGYDVSGFAQTVQNGLYDQSKGNIYPGKNMDLTCNPPDSSVGGISWSMNDVSLETGRKYVISNNGKTITVTSTSDGDSGKYACRTIVNSMLYIIWQQMTVLPFPNVNVNTSKTLKCDNSSITLQCCADSNYTIQWGLKGPTGTLELTGKQTGCNTYTYPGSNVGDCRNSDSILAFSWQVRESNGDIYSSNDVTINVTSKNFYCYSDQFGAGELDNIQTGPCDAESVGIVTAKCKYNTAIKGDWTTLNTTCILRALQNLLGIAKNLQPEGVPQFMADLQNVTATFADQITGSTLNMLTTVELLKTIANVSQLFLVDQPIMTNFLKTLDVIGSTNAQDTWQKLNIQSSSQGASSELLKSTEDMGSTLTDETFTITTNSTQLNRTSTNGPFFGTFGINSSTQIEIPEINGQTFITTIAFLTFDNVLPVRNATYNDSTSKASINADVVAVIVNNTVYNISLTFDVRNTSLTSPQCVFWNFSLLDGIGGWDSTGCEVKPLNQTGTFKCECNHTTSFSLLMSPFFVDSLALAFITFIGVGISMICLILGLIIEIIVWKPLTRNDTAYMRHVSIVNIALSLLAADICFIIGAAIVKDGEMTPVGPCTAATFFMHFFYLALFFWMLFSALLLFYRTVMVFSRTSKAVMMVIAFAIGYVAPLLTAVITVASTAGGGGYIQEQNACWLNWIQTKALLAFVIPALTIVAINFLVLLVVVGKMLRRGVGATNQPDEKHALVVIARCVAILTPLFGLTWAFGIGTMVSPALGIHIVFALLNSLQGFFVFVFGILMDSKIRKELAGKLTPRSSSSAQTKTTSAGVSSSTGGGLFNRRRRGNGYNVSSNSGLPTSSVNESDTFINT